MKTLLALALIALPQPSSQNESSGIPQTLEPRKPLPAQPLFALPLPGTVLTERFVGPLAAGQSAPVTEHRLGVKFNDALLVRADASGGLSSLAGADLSTALEVSAELGVVFRQAIQAPAERLADLEERAAARSGRAQPDLAGILYASFPGDLSAEQLVQVGARLQALDAIEYATIETLGTPPPGDIAPPTPSFVSSQGYLQADPGFDAKTGWLYGARGTGIRLSDCEYGWVSSHEDLVDVDLHPEPGQTVNPSVAANGWDDHGAAALGEAIAPDNKYGCKGAVPDAEAHTYTEWSVEEGFRRLTAITNAIADSGPGDVVMLEMQTFGPGGDYGPAELDANVWAVTRAGVDAGVVVVGAAGNGNQDLDSAAYSSYTAMGDSGAILVGAGTNTASHAKLSFSTFGARVDVQAWGTSAFSLGYGDAAFIGSDPNQAYTNFSGTSSATPMAASCAVALQDLSIVNFGAPMDPEDLRDLLKATGVPGAPGGKIGPMVNLAGAIDALALPWTPIDDGAILGSNGFFPLIEGQGPMTPGSSVTVRIEQAQPVASGVIVAGLSRLDLPLLGGVLVPAADFLIPFSTDLDGVGSVTAPVPGLSSGSLLYLQAWVVDAGAASGFAASRGLQAELQ